MNTNQIGQWISPTYSATEIAPKVFCSLSSIIEDLNCVDLPLYPNYYARRRKAFGSTRMLLEDYLKLDKLELDGFQLLCPERILSSQITSKIKFHTPLSANVESAEAVLHAGHQSTCGPVHYDWDHQWVLQICLSGKKRFCLFPPESGWLLQPNINTSGICVPELPGEDRAALLSALCGVEFVLHPGESVIFPSLWWHGIFYEEKGIAVSVRFGRVPWARPFAALPPSWFLQRVVWMLFREPETNKHRDTLFRLLNTFFQPGNAHERRLNMMEVCRIILLENGEGRGIHQPIHAGFDAEAHLGSEEIDRYYGELPENLDGAHVEARLEWMFEGYEYESLKNPERQLGYKLASYALQMNRCGPLSEGFRAVRSYPNLYGS